MYDMYPEAWSEAAARSAGPGVAQPRRRSRKEHSVTPPPVAEQVRTRADRTAAA